MGTIFKGIGIILLIILVLGLPLMWLWNWLMPIIFHLPEITFWQAVGLNLLSAMLFTNKGSSKD